MKIIEGLKKIKMLRSKIEDLKDKTSTYCADMDCVDPHYGTVDKQEAQIKDWLQSVHDSCKEIMRLKTSIQKTNLQTMVKIEIADNVIEHSISEWIIRRVELAKLEFNSWQSLTNRDLKMQNYSPNNSVNDPELRLTKPRLYFDPKIRDKKITEYNEEPNLIDSKLEVVNAVTDII